MMRRLLKKELREKRTPAIALLVVLVGGTHLGFYSLLFAGQADESSVLSLWFASMLALLIGLSAYTGELVNGRADFLMSRPVPWRKLLVAKLVVCIGSVVLAATAAGMSYWLLLPSEYHQFATLGRAGLGMLLVCGFTVVPCLVGLVCSTVLPGVFGSALVMSIVYMGGLMTVASFEIHHAKSLVWPAVAWIVGAPVAAVVTARFGLTLPPIERARRYAIAALAVAALIAPVGYITGWPHIRPNPESSGDPFQRVARWFSSLTKTEIGRGMDDSYSFQCIVSPDGSSAVVQYEFDDPGFVMIDLRTNL